MTAAQIIDEIKSLPPDEQAGIVRFVYQLDAERKLSGSELSTLADRFVSATDPVEAIAGASSAMLSQNSFTSSMRSGMGSRRSSWIDAFMAPKFRASIEPSRPATGSAEIRFGTYPRSSRVRNQSASSREAKSA